jgi:integrase
MPATQRGHARRLPSGKWQLRYRDEHGGYHSGGVFTSRTQALDHYRDTIAPRLRGEPEAKPDLTLSALTDLYLTRHGQVRSPRTIRCLRERMRRPLDAYGDVTLSELERMSGELADFRATLPPRYAHAVMRTLRQVLAAAGRYGLMSSNPAVAAGENPAPAPREVRVYTLPELDALEAELGERGPFVPLIAATGLRPLEAALLERRDVDRAGRVFTVRGTKTAGAHRQVPLSGRAQAALDRLPARIDTPLLFPAPGGGPLNLNNFRRREWAPAVTAAGIPKPARIYDLRSTFASNALAAGITVFELAKVMGTSTRMIEKHYGALLDGAHAGLVGRLDAIEAELSAQAEQREEGEGR